MAMGFLANSFDLSGADHGGAGNWTPWPLLARNSLIFQCFLPQRRTIGQTERPSVLASATLTDTQSLG